MSAEPETTKDTSEKPDLGNRLITIEALRAEIKISPPDHQQVMREFQTFAREAAVSATAAHKEQIAEIAAKARSILMDQLQTRIATFDFTGILAKTIVAESLQSLREIGINLRRRLPPNWPHDVEWDTVLTVIQQDGIPLVWVPREEIVEAILAAPGRADRLNIILDRSAEIIEDCQQSLKNVDDPALSGQLPLAVNAIDALAAGHHQAAQALAVVVTETAVNATLGANYGRDKYRKIQQAVAVDPEELTLADLRIRSALAPVGPFYTPWWPSSGDPAPEELRRHVSVHQADTVHYTIANAHLAALLVASVLPALQEFRQLMSKHNQAS